MQVAKIGNKNAVKHGYYKHPIYRRWFDMMRRCYDPRRADYQNYGARGVTVCARWHKVNYFIEDMAPTFKEGLSIDRINNNGNYELSNCKWSTRKEQNSNKRKQYTKRKL